MSINLDFYFWDFFACIVLYAAYCLAPVRMLGGRKYEYVKFFLLFFGLWLPILFCIKQLIGGRDGMDIAAAMFRGVTIPLLWLAHRLYPFKTVSRNRHLSFFLGIITIILVLAGLLMLGVWVIIMIFDPMNTNRTIWPAE
jgi:hypothetical protein